MQGLDDLTMHLAAHPQVALHDYFISIPMEERLQQKAADYQKFVEQKLGQNGEAISKNEELTKPIVEKINKILEKIAQDENYDFIFDARSGGVVFAKKTYNLTERVIALLNKEK